MLSWSWPLWLLLSTLATAMPYREGASYGYYDPYPPAEADQVLYEFSPVEERGDTSSTDFSGSAPRSRETRDLSWRDDVDAFLSGAKEPTCEQLRDMWRVARDIQQRRAMRTNEVPQAAADSNFVRYNSGGAGNGAAEAEEEETIGYGSSAAQTPRADRRRMSVPPHARSAAAPAREDKSVFGVVHTHEPVRPNGMHVRDPAKEIYGLLRGSSGPSKSISSTPSSSAFGNVKTHEDEEAVDAEQSYFDKLREKLHRESGGGDFGRDNHSSFGVVHFSEQHPTASPTPSSLDRVRAMIAANRMENEVEDEEGDEDDTSSFDLIRDRLMNTRLTSGRHTAAARLHGARNRAFRQKEVSRQHRRRSIREIVDSARRRALAAASIKARAEAAARRRAMASAAWLQEQEQQMLQQQQQQQQRRRRHLLQERQRQLEIQRRQRKKARKQRERQRQKNRRNRRRRRKKLRQLQTRERGEEGEEVDEEEEEIREGGGKSRRRGRRKQNKVP